MNAAALGVAGLALAANLLGAVAVTYRRKWSVRSLETMIALSAGFMISVSLADLLPEAIARGGERAGLVATFGFLLVHLTQHTFARHFHFGEETHEVTPMVSASALVGLLLHTFVDGVAIASGFAVDASLGVLVSTGIFLHKLPEGLAISSLFLAAGQRRGRALAAAALLGVSTVVGVAVADTTGLEGTMGLAVSAGVTLYVAACNLIPEIQNKRGWRLPVAFFAGSGLYFAARALLAGSGGQG